MPATLLGIATWKIFVSVLLGVEFFMTFLLFACDKPPFIKNTRLARKNTLAALFLTIFSIAIMIIFDRGLYNWGFKTYCFVVIITFPICALGSSWYHKQSRLN